MLWVYYIDFPCGGLNNVNDSTKGGQASCKLVWGEGIARPRQRRAGGVAVLLGDDSDGNGFFAGSAKAVGARNF